MAESDRTVPSAQTHEEDEKEAFAGHGADRAPTPEEEAAADAVLVDGGVAEGVAEHEKDMAQRGANVQGEGQIS